jgi:hypothetical protein
LRIKQFLSNFSKLIYNDLPQICSDGSVAVNTTHGAEKGATQESEEIKGPDAAYGEIRR